MSFYQVLKKRYPDKKEAHIAVAIGVSVMTFRGWKLSWPTLESLVRIAEHIGEDDAVLAKEAIEELKREREARP
jgi:hypothetical protein